MRAGEQFQFLEISSKIQLPQPHQSAPLRSAASFLQGKPGALPRQYGTRKNCGESVLPCKFRMQGFLPQILNRSYLKNRCTITGGAYFIARRVIWCVRNTRKSGTCLNCTRRTHQTVTQRPFSPPSFPARRKRWGRRRHVGNGFDGTSLRYARSLLSA